MTTRKNNILLPECFVALKGSGFSSLDLLSSRTFAEKMIELALLGVPSGPPAVTAGLRTMAADLAATECRDLKVVVFGGGTGLSTIIGGDSRSSSWPDTPFHGLKEIFPNTRAIVCTTDDGGSTGELMKDLPLIGLGDIRHVMLSSIQKSELQKIYGLDDDQADKVAAALYHFFNYRFKNSPQQVGDLLDNGVDLQTLPEPMAEAMLGLISRLFDNGRFVHVLTRPHCLGNLLITSAIYMHQSKNNSVVCPEAIRDGLRYIAGLIGVGKDAVLPCTTTPSLLKIHYANGVSVTGESKSGSARRGYPVEQVSVAFSETQPFVLPEVRESIVHADIIIYAPGSLYTSIVPILQVPGFSETIRENKTALKILVANLWVQRGETDQAMDHPERRFYVSDLIKAYHRNIPGGVNDLFQQVMLLGMHDIPGSILQSYAVEGKNPIYLDRGKVWEMGFSPVEANIFLKETLEKRIVRHDPAAFAIAVKSLWAIQNYSEGGSQRELALAAPLPIQRNVLQSEIPCQRFVRIVDLLEKKGIDERDTIADILWRHRDIPTEHLQLIDGIDLVDNNDWARCQEWDNVYSFYDPDDKRIKIRQDMLYDATGFEVAFLVALGQSLLGDYAENKRIVTLKLGGEELGKVYHLDLKSVDKRTCFFSGDELNQYLSLARMRQSESDGDKYTRVMNAQEGFTPPGLLFGLTYAWYLDNRFASHIEYKMAIARTKVSNLVPEQVKSQARRRALIDFFRSVVFKQVLPAVSESDCVGK